MAERGDGAQRQGQGIAAVRRTQAERAGRRAEFVAAAWLRLHGYRLLERRFRTPQGEIDLIVARRGRIAFVEVKLRASVDAALAAVTPLQQRRVRRAAEWWLAQHPGQRAAVSGFDVVALVPWRLPVHVVDAFTHLS